MKYLLNAEYALRSFIGVSYCFYQKGALRAEKLSREEFDFLVRCDGLHELDETRVPSTRVKAMIHPVSEGETLSKWQRYRHCGNRYFPTVNWMITGRCNYNCRHCFNAADLNPLASEWTKEEAEIFLDEAELCGVNAFTLTGGEPMLHGSFMDIVKGIHERGMSVFEINTNGFYLKEDILQQMKAIGERPLMKISFDGLGWHDWMRQKEGAEKDTLAAIRLCVKEGFPVKVQFNVHRANTGSIRETCELMESMGVQETRIIRTSEAPRWQQLAKGQTLTFREYYEAMLAFSEEWLKTPHSMRITLWLMDSLEAVTDSESSEWETLNRFNLHSYACPDCRFLLAVTAEGDLVPCMQMSGRFSQDEKHLGNVKGGGLQKFLQESSYLDTVSLTVGDVTENSPACNECSFFLECQGGCRAMAILTSGRYLGPDQARCVYYKEGYAQRLKELKRRGLTD